jgi:prepilin-type N-terminal cleavage/methylation domain-containing protein
MSEPKPRPEGFTLVEIMTVVAIIGMLMLIAIPRFMRARSDSQNNCFIQNLRIACDAFTMYAVQERIYPADEMPGVVPAGMTQLLSRMKWDLPTTIGGRWDWDFQQYGFMAGVSVSQPNRTDAQMQVIDGQVDDGDLNAGTFRKTAGGFISIIEF